MQLGDNGMMQAVLKMGDGVSRTASKPVPQELQHQHSKVSLHAHGHADTVLHGWCAGQRGPAMAMRHVPHGGRSSPARASAS